MKFFCKLTIPIPSLPCLFSMANAVSSTVESLKSVTSDSVNSFDFVMCSFTSKYFPVDLVPFADRWWRTWLQTLHLMTAIPVSSIPQCKQYCHDSACLELFQAIGWFEPTFMEAHQPSNMICGVRLLKSRIRTYLFIKDITTSSNGVCKDFESDLAVGISILCNSTWETVNRYILVKHNAASWILTIELQAWNRSELWDFGCIFVKLYTGTYWKDWPLKTVFQNNAALFSAVKYTEFPQKLLMLHWR